MNIALWAAQIFVALVVTLTGLAKTILPRDQLAKRMHWAASWPELRIKLLGLAEVAGGVGLIVPAATHIAPLLTPIAALCLAFLMGGAIQTHRRLGESAVPAVIVGVLCLVIAVGRAASLHVLGVRS